MKKQNNKSAALFQITGEVTGIYQGAKADYLTVKVQPDPDDYYDTFRVAVDKDSGIEEGDNVKLTGSCTSFWNKNKKVMEYSFNATKYEEV